MNANGSDGQLVIRAVNEDGTVDVQLNDLARGFWDEAAQRLTVITTEAGPVRGLDAEAVLGGARVFTGHQFSTPPIPRPGQDVVWTLAGSYQASVNGAGTSAKRNVFGWFAQLNEIV